MRSRTTIFASRPSQSSGLRARDGEIVGYELLVRMRSPTGELLAPDKFLDAADRYELLPALDRWVMCSAIDALRSQGRSLADLPHCFTVNVSAQSIATGQYAAFALEQLAQAALPPAAFCFEIKEAAAVNHLQAAEQFIRELTRAGCKVALDDFGSGLSSLAHLKRLPVQYLKIDGRFVRRVLEDRVAESIVSGIAKAARTLGVSAIAEHVESAQIAARLRELDVEYGQGFYLGRPQAFGRAIEASRLARDRPVEPSRPRERGRSSHRPLSRSPYNAVTFCQQGCKGRRDAQAPDSDHRALRRRAGRGGDCLCYGQPAARLAPRRRYERQAVREPRQRHAARGPRAQSELRARPNVWRAGRLGQGAYLVDEKPAQLRVAELEAELAGLRGQFDQVRNARSSAEDELNRLGKQSRRDHGSADAIQDTVGRLRSENEAYEARLESYRRSLPLPWVVAALVVTLVAGFSAGLWWLDALIRRRHGGFRVY